MNNAIALRHWLIAPPAALTACRSGVDAAELLVVIKIERVVLLHDAAFPFCIDISAIEAFCGTVDVFPPGAPAVVVVVVVVVVFVAVIVVVTVEVTVMVDVAVTVLVLVVVVVLVVAVVMVEVVTTVVEVKMVAVDTAVDVIVDVDVGCPFVTVRFWVIPG